MKKSISPIMGIVVLISFAVFVLIFSTYKHTEKPLTESNSSESSFQGHIESLSNEHGLVTVRLIDCKNSYSFFPLEIVEGDRRRNFMSEVQFGDSIFKRLLSDTVYIIRDSVTQGWTLLENRIEK
jgi:hypothetical protein